MRDEFLYLIKLSAQRKKLSLQNKMKFSQKNHLLFLLLSFGASVSGNPPKWSNAGIYKKGKSLAQRQQERKNKKFAHKNKIPPGFMANFEVKVELGQEDVDDIQQYEVGKPLTIGKSVKLAQGSAYLTKSDLRVFKGRRVGSVLFEGRDAASLRLLMDYKIDACCELVVSGQGDTNFVTIEEGDCVGGGVQQKTGVLSGSISGSEALLDVVCPANVSNDMFVDVKEVAIIVGGVNPGPEFATNLCTSGWDDCIQDFKCHENSGTVWDADGPITQSIAKAQWRNTAGSISTCTVGLINPSCGEDTLAISADHCFSAGTDLSTAEFFFGFTTNSCTDASDIATACQQNSQVFEPITGGVILKQDSSQDYALLRLNEMFEGAVFRGYSTESVDVGADLFRASHPAFGPLAYTEHFTQNDWQCSSLPRSDFIYSRATLGDTMGGSSGSPVVSCICHS